MANEQPAAETPAKAARVNKRAPGKAQGKMAGKTSGKRPSNENTAGMKTSAEKSTGENPAGRNSSHRSRHRSGRSGRPSGHMPAGNANDRQSSQPRKWREYLIQLSVVIIGIMVTFIGSDLISRWARQRQVRAVMQLVVEELKENRRSVENICAKLIYDRNGMLMIGHYDFDIDATPIDSLEKYQYILGTMNSLKIQSDALEVLKTSGLIPAIGDKETLMDLLKSYSVHQEFRIMVGSYNDLKRNAVNHLYANPQKPGAREGGIRGMWKTIKADPVYTGFLGSAYNYFGGVDFFDRIRRELDKTIAAINEKYNFEE